MEVYGEIEIQDPSNPDSMMSLTLSNKTTTTREVDKVAAKLEELDLESIDSYLDLGLMENKESEIKDTLEEELISKMMYEEERLWNMEEISQWDDEYIIDMRNIQQEDDNLEY